MCSPPCEGGGQGGEQGITKSLGVRHISAGPAEPKLRTWRLVPPGLLPRTPPSQGGKPCIKRGGTPSLSRAGFSSAQDWGDGGPGGGVQRGLSKSRLMPERFPGGVRTICRGSGADRNDGFLCRLSPERTWRKPMRLRARDFSEPLERPRVRTARQRQPRFCAGQSAEPGYRIER